jgi:hypothetical protein
MDEANLVINQASSDPGARGGALGLVVEGSHQSGARSRASSCPVVGSGVRVVPLNAWARLLVGLGDPRCYGGGLIGVQVERCDVVRLHLTAEQEELLRFVGDQCARLINMENYRRRQLFFKDGKIDTGVKLARELAKKLPEYLEVKRTLGSMNFDETLRKVSEAWRSFAELLRERGEGKLPPWLNPRPPGYRKRGGERVPIVIVRADNYRVDAERKGHQARILEHRCALHGQATLAFEAWSQAWEDGDSLRHREEEVVRAHQR